MTVSTAVHLGPLDDCFDEHLARHGAAPLARGTLETVQVNLGKRCNQACHHCHVDAGPLRTESMAAGTVDRLLELLADSHGVGLVDVTGGAPELHPAFARIVRTARSLGKRVMDRCNLTVLFEPGQEGLLDLLAAHEVEVVCSLPCYTAENVDRQRGRGVFERSVEALRGLNERGYGDPAGPLRLHLVYNPLGPFLPPEQAGLAARYREELGRDFGIRFDELFTITNMPIRRFAADLERRGELEAYRSLLVTHFNPATLDGLMCRGLVSVGWQGTLHDCDFNQMLEMPIPRGGPDGTRPLTLWDVERLDEVAGSPVRTGPHCFGCTAGAGSSCGGALADAPPDAPPEA